MKLVDRKRSFASLMDDAREIRGPRFTVLDTRSNGELEAEYRAYRRSLAAPVTRTRLPIAGAAAQ